MAEGDIEVTVIGGYLGAGKTTLVNHVLSSATERIAVLVNDFGDVDIDGDLIADHDGSTISLTNGCICCSLVDGFAAALKRVMAADSSPSRLVIEASGVADPATVASYGHAPGLRLDAIVVVVDAETILRRAEDEYVGDTVVGQLRPADIVVVNKLDLIGQREATQTRDWLGRQAPGAILVDAVHAVVDPQVLFGSITRPVSSEAPAAAVPAAEQYESWTWSSPEPVRRAVLEGMFDTMPASVVRAKGIVWLIDQPERPMVVQAVGRRWSVRPLATATGAARAGSASPGPSRVVFIGRRGAFAGGFGDALGR